MERSLWVAVVCLLVVSCGANTGPPIGYSEFKLPKGQCDPAGIFDNFYGVAVVEHDGSALITMANGVVYEGQVDKRSLDPGHLCGGGENTFRSALAPGATYPDGSVSAEGKLAGNIMVGDQMTVTSTMRTAAGTDIPIKEYLSYVTDHALPAQLATVVGTYQASSGTMPGMSLTIDAGGAAFGQDAATGCVLNGRTTAAVTGYNRYNVSVGFGNCTGVMAVLNGLQGTGVAYFRPASTPAPARLSVILIERSSVRSYSTVWTFTRS
jgi:hypothetical protein